MNKIQNWEELLFIKQNGCSFGFDGRVTQDTKTRARFVPNISCVQNQESTELTQENTLRINMLKDFCLDSTFSSTVELSHKNNFPIPTYMVIFRKAKIK